MSKSSTGEDETTTKVTKARVQAGARAVRRVPARLTAALLGVALLATAGLVATSLFFSSRATASANSETTVMAIARQDAVDFTTYNYHHLATDFARFSAETTGNFRTQYKAGVPDLITAFRAKKVAATGQVISTAILSATPTSATVLVGLNDLISNTLVTAPKTVYDRLAMVMTKVDGQWKVEAVHEL